ncbi:SDR family NAD(P)-dependent oxidoreductase [Candidatus Woesearchaeota archaeon]|nr:SDR family NAD(P)-dependent oxidoreductase [Candidatus Woesearchaeota archaeon]
MKSSKTILVTGGNGHIGFNVLKEVVKKYKNVYVLGRRISNKLAILIKENNVNIIKCDITDAESLSRFKNDFEKIDVVIHLAAFVPKTKEADNTDTAMKINLIGTMNLAKLVKNGSKFIFISTCEVYGVPKTAIIREEHPLNPLSYYGKSKANAELFLQSYSAKKEINLVILRLTSVYGPGELINRAIPNFISAAIINKSPIIYGDGSDKRDFIFIDDVVNYIIATIEQGFGVYNIATGKIYSIKEIAEKIIKIAKANVNVKFKEIKKHKMDYIFDITRAKEFGYTPKIEIDEGLSKEIGWFKYEK